MTAPPPHPSSPVPGDDPPQADRAHAPLPRTALVAGAAVLGLAAILALASRGTSVWATPREGTTDRGDLLVTLGTLAAVVAVAAFAISLIVHRVASARGADAPPLRTTLLRALPLALVAMAVLSLVVIARTDLEPEQPTIADESPTDVGSGGTGFDPRTATARLGDFDGDGRPDIGIDTDGDGIIDYVTWPSDRGDIWPDLDGGDGELYLGRLPNGGLTGGIDFDGDGAIDQDVDFDDDADRSLDVEPGSGVDPDELLDQLEDGERDPSVNPEPEERSEDSDAGRDDDADDDGPDLGALGPILLGLLIAVVAAFIAAALWAWYRDRQRRGATELAALHQEAEHEAAKAAMAETVENTIDAMLADPDPRTAIIGAYARLLEGLAASGVGRLDHEAPMEHLQRALTILDVRPEPLRRLIELFSMARFSMRPLTEAHRAEALEGLRAAATDLAASRLPPPEMAGAPR